MQQIAQPTNVSCWATAASMVLGWRDRMSLTVEGIAERAGLTTATGLDPAQVGQFATDMGMTAEPPQSYTIEALRATAGEQRTAMGRRRGAQLARDRRHRALQRRQSRPTCVSPIHGTATLVRPVRRAPMPARMPREAATSCAGPISSPNTRRPRPTYTRVNLQILHCSGTYGHAANTGGSTPPGYAMGADDDAEATSPSDADVTLFPPPPLQARALDVLGTVSTIGGLVPQVLSDSSGDVSWELDQLRGLKHPNDRAPAKPGPFTDAATIRLDDWPKLALYGIDDIYAWFTIDWQHNGKSLGNVRIGNIATNDAKGMKLKVRAQIMDDNILYEPGGIAALRVRFHYRFSRLIGDDIIAVTDLQLFADGTYLRESKWLQKSTI